MNCRCKHFPEKFPISGLCHFAAHSERRHIREINTFTAKAAVKTKWSTCLFSPTRATYVSYFLIKPHDLLFSFLFFQLKMTLISPAIGIIKSFTRWELFNKVRPLILLATERFSRMCLRVYLHFAVICPQFSCFVWHVFCVILQFHQSQLKVHFHWGEDYNLPRSTTHERVNLAYTHSST